MTSFAEALKVKERVERQLLTFPGVHTVSLGGKVRAKVPTGEVAICVHVLKKKPLSDISSTDSIPATIDGITTDVVEGGPSIPSAYQGGIDISYVDNSHAGETITLIGTLGCFARTNEATPRPVLLSNDHVLYGSVPGPRRSNGDPVTVSSSTGCCHTTIGSLFATSGPTDPLIDAAIALVAPAIDWQAQIHGVAVTGTLDFRSSKLSSLPAATQNAIANQSYIVHKFGATTGLTNGKVINVAGTTKTRNDQLLVAPLSGDYFSQPGDSGSAIYDDAGNIIALLWGNDVGLDPSDPLYVPPPWSSSGCHIYAVTGQLGITIATNEPSVVYRVGGKPELHPALSRIYTDLTLAGRQKEFFELYGRHSEEIRVLLKQSRSFVVAWHRNHGPKIVRAISDLAAGSLGVLPRGFEGRSWAACIQHIAESLMLEGSSDLRASIGRYRSIAGQLGGRSYDEFLGFLLISDIAEPGAQLTSKGVP
jgi:hypothetical protein